MWGLMASQKGELTLYAPSQGPAGQARDHGAVTCVCHMTFNSSNLDSNQQVQDCGPMLLALLLRYSLQKQSSSGSRWSWSTYVLKLAKPVLSVGQWGTWASFNFPPFCYTHAGLFASMQCMSACTED